MLIKEVDCKINFIDEGDIFVGFDNCAQCCESFGWYIIDKVDASYSNKCDDSLEDGFCIASVKGYVFDTSFFELHEENDCDVDMCAVFKIVKSGDRDLYLHLFNHHNGYYSHGFVADIGGDVWQEGYL